MKAVPKLLLGFVLTLAVGACAQSETVDRGQFATDIAVHSSVAPSSTQVDSESSAWAKHGEVTSYATAFDGDHSLEAATVDEQAFARYTLYIVRLKFASGTEQSLAVVAPPGGLQPEMCDMSGDSVPNDLVLSSKLFRSPLVVMLNNGHDQLTVAFSPGSFAPGEGRASHEFHNSLALASGSFKVKALANSEGLLLPQLEQSFLSPVAEILTPNARCATASGRAPPMTTTTT
ncbi:MAG TPA: hypothetical protein VGH37_01280 [Candidatus Acidoferrum sp.]|jgi:hypothetical protein